METVEHETIQLPAFPGLSFYLHGDRDGGHLIVQWTHDDTVRERTLLSLDRQFGSLHRPALSAPYPPGLTVTEGRLALRTEIPDAPRARAASGYTAETSSLLDVNGHEYRLATDRDGTIYLKITADTGAHAHLASLYAGQLRLHAVNPDAFPGLRFDATTECISIQNPRPEPEITHDIAHPTLPVRLWLAAEDDVIILMSVRTDNPGYASHEVIGIGASGGITIHSHPEVPYADNLPRNAQPTSGGPSTRQGYPYAIEADGSFHIRDLRAHYQFTRLSDTYQNMSPITSPIPCLTTPPISSPARGSWHATIDPTNPSIINYNHTINPNTYYYNAITSFSVLNSPNLPEEEGQVPLMEPFDGRRYTLQTSGRILEDTPGADDTHWVDEDGTPDDLDEEPYDDGDEGNPPIEVVVVTADPEAEERIG